MWAASFYVPDACLRLVACFIGGLNVADFLLCTSCVPALGSLFYGVAECKRHRFMYQLRAGAWWLVLRIGCVWEAPLGWLNMRDILLCTSSVPALGRLFYGLAECGRHPFMYQLRAGAWLLVLRGG